MLSMFSIHGGRGDAQLGGEKPKRPGVVESYLFGFARGGLLRTERARMGQASDSRGRLSLGFSALP